jgi:hypothetical protein
MSRIISILLFLIPVGLFGQTPITSIQVDTFYLSGILNGQYQIFKASEFLGGGGGAGTDDQTIDVFQLSGTELQLSLEDDGEATQTVELSSLQDGTGTDDQTLAEVLSQGATANTDIDMATNGISNIGSLEIDISGTTTEGLRINGIASQTSDYLHIQDSGGADIMQLNVDESLQLNAYGTGTLGTPPAQLTGFSSGGTVLEFDFDDLTDGGAFFGSGDKIIFWNGTAFRSADYDDLPSGGGGGDNLGNHTATASLNLNGNEIDSVAILSFEDTDADANFWGIFEDASGELVIQDNAAATDDFVINQDGSIEIGNTPTTDNTEEHILVWDSSTKHIEKREVSSLPSGGSGSGTTLYFFDAIDTTAATTIAQDTWTDVIWEVEIKEDASFTHDPSTDPEQITLDSTGLYRIEANIQFDMGGIRSDGNIRIQVDTGGGFVDLPYNQGYNSFAGESFGAVSVSTRGVSLPSIPYEATAGDVIKIQVYNDSNGDWTFAEGSSISITRVD